MKGGLGYPSATMRMPKISREVSNCIVEEVLKRSNILIKNSYRRLTSENNARTEHWTKVAEIVRDRFDETMETERVKAHFHNRKKTLWLRIKEELKTIHSTIIDEKLEILIRRKVCVGEIDEQLTRICLEIEEEERGRVENDGAYGGITYQEDNPSSLLCQLLSQAPKPPPMSPYFNFTPSQLSPLLSTPSIDSEPAAAPKNPLLTKLLSEPQQPTVSKEVPIVPDRKRTHSNSCQSYQQPALIPIAHRPYCPQMSHLIVDIESKAELKRLLTLLIDNGFSRFQHIENNPNQLNEPVLSVPSTSEPKRFRYADDNVQESTQSNHESSVNREEVIKTLEKSQKEKVNVEVKSEIMDDDEYGEDNSSMHEDEEVITEMDRESARDRKEMIRNETTTVCTVCKQTIWLNSGGSRWNLYEHVVLRHSDKKPYRCMECNFESSRKMRVKTHAQKAHRLALEPIDLATPELRREWQSTMERCFPQHH